MKLTAGSKIGSYEIVALIGEGGMGEVYKAHDPQLGRDAAVKVLPERISAQKEALARLENEAHLASSLNHPNIVTIYSIGWEGDRRYIAMEFIDGVTLQELMETGPMSLERALNISAQIADGLAKAHEAGIVHRDLKPKNVMVTGDGIAKILDFGLSKFAQPQSQDSLSPTLTALDLADGLTKPGTVLGTVEYMSPEQAAGKPADFRSDQFSMGSLMYSILSGNKPFHRDTPVQTLSFIIEGEPSRLSHANPQVPKALEDIIQRCMMKDPRDRYPTTRELAHNLRELELVRQMPPRRWTRRDWLRTSLGFGIPLAAGGSVWIWTRRPYQPAPTALDWYQKGVAALHSMTFDAARKAFDQAVAADPKFALAHANLARAYDELDYSGRAKDSMLRAMTVEQETRLSSTDETRLKALQFMISREYDRAVPQLRELEKSAEGPEKAAAALESGWLAQQREDTEGAAAAYDRAIRINPRYAAARLRLGYIQGRRAQDDQALKNFEKAQELYDAESNNEGITECLYQRANLLSRRSRADEAMPLIEKAINLANAVDNRYQEIRLRILQSSVARKQKKYKYAVELAEEAITAAQSENMDILAISATHTLGNAFLDIRDYDSGEKNFRKALELAHDAKSKRYEALESISLGSLFEQKIQPEKAREFLDAATKFYRQAGYRREFAQAMTILGGVLCQLSEFDEGVRVLREALPGAIQLQDRVTEVQLRERLADILREKGAWPEALQEMEVAAGKSGSGWETRLNFSGLYWRLGRRQDAEQCWSTAEQLLRKDPDGHMMAVLRLRQAEIAYAESHFGEAAANARRSIAAEPGTTDHTEESAKLIQALVAVRSGHRNDAIQAVLQMVEESEKAKLDGNAAHARLSLAEALAEVNDRALARELALDALGFFEKHKVWEAVWRAHVTAARMSNDPAEAEAHKESARVALAELKKLWPARDVETYLRRPDIKRLSAGIQL